MQGCVVCNFIFRTDSYFFASFITFFLYIYSYQASYFWPKFRIILYFICFFSDWQNLTSLNYDKLFAYGCLNKIPFREITLNSTFIEQEKTVLMEIFNGTNGHNWRNNKHWENYSVSHCLWYGITCDPRTNRSVISIFLERNNLVGTLPRSLWRLRNL